MTKYADRTTGQLVMDLAAAKAALAKAPDYHRAVLVQVIEKELASRKVKPINYTLELVT